MSKGYPKYVNEKCNSCNGRMISYYAPKNIRKFKTAFICSCDASSIKEIKKNSTKSLDQVTKLWLYFRLLKDDVREEFVDLVNLIFVLSEKKQTLTKEEIQLEVLKRYFIS